MKFQMGLTNLEHLKHLKYLEHLFLVLEYLTQIIAHVKAFIQVWIIARHQATVRTQIATHVTARPQPISHTVVVECAHPQVHPQVTSPGGQEATVLAQIIVEAATNNQVLN